MISPVPNTIHSFYTEFFLAFFLFTILNSHVVSLPLQSVLANFCEAMDNLIDQDTFLHPTPLHNIQHSLKQSASQIQTDLSSNPMLLSVRTAKLSDLNQYTIRDKSVY